NSWLPGWLEPWHDAAYHVRTARLDRRLADAARSLAPSPATPNRPSKEIAQAAATQSSNASRLIATAAGETEVVAGGALRRSVAADGPVATDRTGAVDSAITVSTPVAAGTPANKSKPLFAVMLGSSRVMNGFDGRSFERELGREVSRPVVAANLGVPGAGPVDSLVQLGRLLRDGRSPDLVLIEILPNQFNTAPDSSPPLGASASLDAADRKWLEQFRLAIPEATAQPIRNSPLAVWNYRRELLRATFPKILDGGDSAIWARNCDECGSRLRYEQATPDLRRASLEVARKQFAEPLANCELGGDGFTALDAMLETCREQRIPAALVIMPEGPEFRSWYRPGTPEQLLTRLRELASRRQAELIDHWDAMPEEAFIDSHHLLAPGAIEFSSRLAVSAADCLIDAA
ncbi:MAG TPA: hypothetical protein PLV92_26950, partial [Pirellulaceae bacterium]|nr:hypothetical protein [Pirellulaceae bacterium]